MPTSPDITPGHGRTLTRREFNTLLFGGGLSLAAAKFFGGDLRTVNAQEITPTEAPFPLPEYDLGTDTELSSILNGLLTDNQRSSATPIDVPLSISVTPQPDTEQPNFFSYDQNSSLGQRLTGILSNFHSLLNEGAQGTIDFNARVENGVITTVAPYIRLTADYENETGLLFLADSTLAWDSEGRGHYQIPIPGINDTQRGRFSSVRPVRLEGNTHSDYSSLMRERHPEFIPQQSGTLLMGQIVQEPGARQAKIAVAIAQNHPVSFIQGFAELGANLRAEPTPTATDLGNINRLSEPVVSLEDRDAFKSRYPDANANYDAPVVYSHQEDGTWYATVDHSVEPPIYGFARSDFSPLNIVGPIAPAIEPLRVAEYRAAAPEGSMPQEANAAEFEAQGQTVRFVGHEGLNPRTGPNPGTLERALNGIGDQMSRPARFVIHDISERERFLQQYPERFIDAINTTTGNIGFDYMVGATNEIPGVDTFHQFISQEFITERMQGNWIDPQDPSAPSAGVIGIAAFTQLHMNIRNFDSYRQWNMQKTSDFMRGQISPIIVTFADIIRFS